MLGRQLELVKYDTKGDANESVNAVKRLIANDKVCAILGPNASAAAIAIKGALNEGKVPDIATVATNRHHRQRGRLRQRIQLPRLLHGPLSGRRGRRLRG